MSQPSHPFQTGEWKVADTTSRRSCTLTQTLTPATPCKGFSHTSNQSNTGKAPVGLLPQAVRCEPASSEKVSLAPCTGLEQCLYPKPQGAGQEGRAASSCRQGRRASGTALKSSCCCDGDTTKGTCLVSRGHVALCFAIGKYAREGLKREGFCISRLRKDFYFSRLQLAQQQRSPHTATAPCRLPGSCTFTSEQEAAAPRPTPRCSAK